MGTDPLNTVFKRHNVEPTLRSDIIDCLRTPDKISEDITDSKMTPEESLEMLRRIDEREIDTPT